MGREIRTFSARADSFAFGKDANLTHPFIIFFCFAPLFQS